MIIEYNEKEMVSLVEKYIFDLKGRKVKIDLYKNSNNPFFALLYQREIEKLIQAYEIAKKYYESK